MFEYAIRDGDSKSRGSRSEGGYDDAAVSKMKVLDSSQEVCVV